MKRKLAPDGNRGNYNTKSSQLLRTLDEAKHSYATAAASQSSLNIPKKKQAHRIKTKRATGNDNANGLGAGLGLSKKRLKKSLSSKRTIVNIDRSLINSSTVLNGTIINL